MSLLKRANGRNKASNSFTSLSKCHEKIFIVKLVKTKGNATTKYHRTLDNFLGVNHANNFLTF